MPVIDIQVKSYQELQFEITKLNTDIYLKDIEIKRLNNIINELEKSIIQTLECYKKDKDYFIDETTFEYLYEKLQELKEGK